VVALAIHPGALGDVLLAVPALRALGAAPGGARVVLAAQPRIGALLTALGVVDAHRDFEALGLAALFVDDEAPAGIPGLRSVARVVCWFGARDPVFVRRLAREAPGAVVASPSGDGSGPVWRHLLDTVEPGGAGRCDPVAVPPALEAEGRAALVAAGWDGRAPLVMVHAGASGPGKCWPAEAFARVLAALPDVAVALHRGPADARATAALAAALPRRPILLDEPPLGALAGAVRHVAAWLGNDSGVSHVAAAVGAPALVLFQPGNLAWQPWSPSARTIVVDTARVLDAEVAAVTHAARAALGAAR
jgi:ADP-heptose:LPS heptosyltransferase